MAQSQGDVKYQDTTHPTNHENLASLDKWHTHDGFIAILKYI